MRNFNINWVLPSRSTITEERQTKTTYDSKSDLRLWRRPAHHTLLKALNISSATAQVAPDHLKAAAIWDTTARRSAVDRQDLKSY